MGHRRADLDDAFEILIKASGHNFVDLKERAAANQLVRELALDRDLIESIGSILRTQNLDCREYLATFYTTQGLYEKAEVLLQQLLETLPSSDPVAPRLYANLAALHNLRGQYERAAALLVQLLVPRPREWPAPLLAQVLLELAHTRQAQGLYGEAESLYSEILEILEDNSDAMPALGARV
ncbi:tetratricopeptide repeat protein [Gloeobacter kilaueensis]|uniref:Protein of avirulence locus involved in temperature-dependent protein secretion n=1 Tax=Gloeobacter kilaueensis (strain ATCC BAA-2537 / CCAP 1431/1 / ULC 316 / JS1) TaxID=1183438 RepID=U5QLL2_GLOK1|nr:tetratricopeptide repeat protein [Gloeobacter kilaueensis]AGY59852.1 protein of avirulence locus involved in temperature-dependent protein secretion [Gloeobacter kilaueensis JS1]